MITPSELTNILRDASNRGMGTDQLTYLYHSLWNGNSPALEPAVKSQIEQIILKVDKDERNIAQEIAQWVGMEEGVISLAKCYTDLDIRTKKDKGAARIALHRLVGKVIERYGEHSGTYRKIQEDKEEQRWWDAKGTPLGLVFPLGIDQAKLYPGNIILIEGSKSQGKTRFALEFARLNRHLLDDGSRIRYQNVEMADDEILKRVEAYEQENLWSREDFRKTVEIKKVTGGWWDFIVKDGFNIVDYLLEYEEPYKIAQYIFNCHEKLGNGIALILVQRDPGKAYGSGGYMIRNIPRLIISLRNHIVKLEDVKAFWMKDHDDRNPTGLVRKYKMPGLVKFITDGGWVKEENLERDVDDGFIPE